MSGFEVAGIVLAVLPLFIEATKYAANARGAISPRTRDEKLLEFYETFWWETYELQKQVERVVMGLPEISEARKREVVENREIEKFGQEKDLEEALRSFLVSDADYAAFQKVMSKVLELLARLVKDETVHLSQSDHHDQGKMLLKLKNYQDGRRSGGLASSFRERFRFLRREKEREACLKNLKIWNQRIHIVVDSACSAADRRKAITTKPPDAASHPLSLLRQLSQRLFSAIWKCWTCDCPVGAHEARFSLASCAHSKAQPCKTIAQLSFDFLMSRHSPQAPPGGSSLSKTPWKWREGTVIIKPQSPQDSQNGAQLENICDVLRDALSPEHGLQLLIEDMERTQQMWRLNWREAQLQYVRTKAEVSLKSILQHTTAPSLVERRRLALVLAHSIIQLHESPWLSDQWSKENICFFSTAAGFDLGRPYMSTALDRFPSGSEPPNLDRFHRNPGILRLGVLLIEIHRWSGLETYWEPVTDLVDGKPTPNTDLQVARRVLRSQALADCFETYRGAIEACLQVPWAHSGSRVSLEDRETQEGIYGHVIEPLEEEVKHGDFRPRRGQVAWV
ncbi:hypothetical protein MAPG_01178 [Magnaporthiopsis poae ATCC 64411]|uniref:DUF7580 domain-containing protein n=1 Tax=Magnaporthiopsis poae (strain ATCC 64411 / 73-15) TaxID=644358 RepID=A0A0C4DN06_MAGP6|nr:hypothetical protein MAPG_01178 [Magnaporthiopsis poae ATCC 64411]